MITDKVLILPSSGSSSDKSEIKSSGSVIIIGANGTGKTRLGAWIEFNSSQKDVVHRISAQKSLNMPEWCSTSSLEMAELNLFYGASDKHVKQNPLGYKTGSRWGNKPNTWLLNDFEKLMVYLFSEEFEKSTTYRQTAKYLVKNQPPEEKSEAEVFKEEEKENKTMIKIEQPPETKLDKIKHIWESILPHRELSICAGKVETKVKGSGSSYNASEMSDGERVIFYLIGQCLAAPKDGIIIIDEPELHLHKSIQTTLWQAVEAERRDCLFVYMTHDVDFAASHHFAKKIWLKAFDGTNWQWEEVQPIEGLPEDLQIEILGNRQPIIFVEGENGSIDVELYRSLYPEHLIIPRGSCWNVIVSTKALKKLPQLHHLKVCGIIDRDRRPKEEIDSLIKDAVFILDVAEVENLFCVPEVLNVVSDHLALDFDEVFSAFKKLVLRSLKEELDVQISLRTASEIRFQLNMFDEKARGKDAICKGLTGLFSGIDANKIYDENERLINEVIEKEDYSSALRIYNRKSLASRISVCFGLKSGELPEFVLRLLKSEKRTLMVDAFNNYLPNINSVT